MTTVPKEGIWELDPDKYQYSRYLVIKKYGDEYKKRFQVTKEDCLQQIEEWDEDYLKHNPCDLEFIRGLVTKEIRERRASRRKKANHYYVYWYGTNKLVAEGNCGELANQFNCVTTTFFNASKDVGRKFKKYYEISTTNKTCLPA